MANLKNTTINDNGFLQIPVGNESERPSSAETGMMRWNTNSLNIEVYNGNSWQNLINQTPSGIHYYNVESYTSNIVQYFTLPAPFDVDNKGSPVIEFNTGGEVSNIEISNNGSLFFSAGRPTGVRIFRLSRPFDLSSATFIGTEDASFSDHTTCLEFAQNGLKFYTNNTNGIAQYSLSVPYDLSTRTLDFELNTKQNGAGPGDPAFSPDGTKVAFGYRGPEFIDGGTCSTPFDLSTFTLEDSFATTDGDPSCAKWNATGTELYVRHASPDMVNEYTTPNPYSINGLSFNRQIFNNPGFAGGGHEFNYNY